MVTDKIKEAVNKAPLTQDYVERGISVNYGLYARWRNKIKME